VIRHAQRMQGLREQGGAVPETRRGVGAAAPLLRGAWCTERGEGSGSGEEGGQAGVRGRGRGLRLLSAQVQAQKKQNQQTAGPKRQ
jgi:hypothetical protein